MPTASSQLNPGGRQPAGFIVRLQTSSGDPAGVGVVVGARQIITCAHVVNSALGRDLRAQEQPDGPVFVTFPLLVAGGNGPSPYKAQVARWLPPPRKDATGDDLAGLVLIDGAQLPAEVMPARLGETNPRPGQVVDVFGYPGTPPRPGGAWVEAAVRGEVGGGRIQLDTTTGAALHIQPGYSGSPVCDRETDRVVGLLSAAPRGDTGQRDSYAISVERLVSAWPELFDPASGTGPRSVGRRQGAASELTILHLSDLRFGNAHVFGGAGNIPSDQVDDVLFRRLHEDLAGLEDEHDLRPDLIVVTGDLATSGLPSEFGRVVTFLRALTEAVDIPRHHVAIVPGNHDVNRKACEAYFARQAADERQPLPPYWPKWEHFSGAFADFYQDVDGVSFSPDEPWTLYEMPDLAVVVAGLNSTMANSHRPGDDYGSVGEEQLRWFADRLLDYKQRGWLRLAAVHHNAADSATVLGENLSDVDDLDRRLGEPALVNLLLHGLTHGRTHRLPSGLMALSTGSAVALPGTHVHDSPGQYQLVTVKPDGLVRYARNYVAGQRRWTGDTRINPTGADWREEVSYPLTEVQGAFEGVTEKHLVGRETGEHPDTRNDVSAYDDFIDRVREATQVNYPDATITLRPGSGYLRVSRPLPNGGCEQWPVGIVDDLSASDRLTAFVDNVHSRFAAADPQVRSEVVHGGAPADESLVAAMRTQGIRLRSFVDYQGLIDLRPLVARQSERIAQDRRYPAELYVPQRYRLLDDRPSAAEDGLFEQVISWLSTEDARFVMLLGDFGRGKTFLLRQLARHIPRRLPGLLPILVELRGLEKAPTLDEILAQHLVRHGVETWELTKLRYMVRSGRLALLFDGFDELALRVSYEHASDYLQTLLEAATDRAKIVLSSRTQHFQSNRQIHTALGDRVVQRAGSRVAIIEDFTEDQIRQFLTNHYRGDAAAANARFDLLVDIQDLLGLSRNPRMLSFIADLDERRLREVQRQHDRISAAELYRELVDFWLVGEANRQRHSTGLPSFDERERLDACTALALRLWTSTAATLPLADLSAEVAATLTRLAERGYSADQATQAVGSGTLLVRTDDEAFTFVHPSVMEWLVASAAAAQLRDRQPADVLISRRLSRLMVDFLCDLAEMDDIRKWMTNTLADTAATGVAKRNALDVGARLEDIAGKAAGSSRLPERAELAYVDLREQDLTGRNLRGANLKGANLRGMRLLNTDFTGADLSDADLTGARLIGGSLDHAIITGSQWSRAALMGVSGLEDLRQSSEFEQVAIAGYHPVQAMMAPSGSASCVAMSPNGAFLAVGRGDVVELVDLTIGKTVRILAAHRGPVWDVAFSADGTLVATASDDGTARIWDTTSGRVLSILAEHEGWVRGVAFSWDARLVATASDDGFARIWDGASRQVRTRLRANGMPVRGVVFSPDGALVATTCGNTAWIWNAISGQARIVLDGHTGLVRKVMFSPDGTLVVTASDDRTARIWDTASGQTRATLSGHTGWVLGATFSPDGTLVATASDDGTAVIWDTTSGQARWKLSGHSGSVLGVTFSPAGTLVATASDDGTVRMWDTAYGQARTKLSGHNGSALGVAFSPNGARLATASNDGIARIWDTVTGNVLTSLSRHEGWIQAVTFSPDSSLLATASDDRTARVWDTDTPSSLATLSGHSGPVLDVAFSPDGHTVATASQDGTARTWHALSGQPHKTLSAHTAPVRGVAFSPAGGLIATASDDTTAQLWHATSGRPHALLPDHTGAVLGITFSPDGSLVATASSDKTAQIWGVTSGRLPITLEGHTGSVLDVAFSPDGSLVATASADKTARIWSSTSGQTRARLLGHTDWVSSVAFSADGSLIATASDDGTTRIWDTATGRWLALLLSPRKGGYGVLLPGGSYKAAGDIGGAMWWVMKLCRFELGELDPYVPAIRRLPPEAKIFPERAP
jgi:WD40 repeat protein/3',5'-cyclic AMP phosphodiesterase CpdA